MARWRNARSLPVGLAMLAAGAASASDDPFGFLLDAPGSAGLGFVSRWEDSPYVDGGTRRDLLPLYLYEGERFFLRANRAGMKLWEDEHDAQRLELFVGRRLEGYPEDRQPESLEGMRVRNTGVDLGLRYRLQRGASTWAATAMHDVGGISHGSEITVDYRYLFRRGRWSLAPGAGAAWRSGDLNDYYFGVGADEAREGREAYRAGSGVDLTLSLNASFQLTRNWRLLGGVSGTWLSSEIEDSPVTTDGPSTALSLGAVYDFGSRQVAWDDEDARTYWKLFYGRAAGEGCHMVRIMSLQCTSLDHETPTAVIGLHAGRPFVERFNGWPLDFVGFVGVLYHDERGQQRNGWQLDAYMKAYYYGFPWSHRVQTRLGFGFGVSYAQRVPFAERVSLEARERNQSKLLNYLDPTIDVNIGDLFGREQWRATWVGLGVSHRSGIFASSRMLGNVDGGSNYIYAYVETAL